MEILQAQEQQLQLIQQFISPYEYSCVQLASYVRRQSKHIYIISLTTVPQKIDDIIGVFSLDRTLVHCIPDFTQQLQLQLTPLLLDFFKDKCVKCIDGEKSVTEFFINLLQANYTVEQINDYRLLILNDEPLPPPQPLSLDDEIKRCMEEDFDLLFELQKMYISKEVAPQNRQVSDLEVSIGLRQILKNQLCFALFSDGELVAKANTNAIGWKWVQLGGIYTHPLYRRNYYAWNLVQTICRRVIKTSRKVCLFVKEKNNPARTLYKRMGFSEAGFFKIAYLKN